MNCRLHCILIVLLTPLLMCLWFPEASISAQPIGERELCIVFDRGPAECVTFRRLRQLLPPEVVQSLEKLLDSLYAKYGLNPRRSALFSCHEGEAWNAVNLKGGAQLNSQPVEPTLQAMLEMLKSIEECRSIDPANNRVSAPYGDTAYDSWVYDTVTQIEKDLEKCRDGSPIAENSGDGSGAPPVTPSDWQQGKRKTVGVINLDENDPHPTPPPTNNPSPSSSLLGSATHRPPPNTSGTKWDRISKTDWNGRIPPSSTPVPLPSDTERSTCRNRQRAWQMFKQHCEQSDWKAYPCVSLLRTLNGCVDITLIEPTPDGDLTCPPWAKLEDRNKEYWAKACKLKAGIMDPGPDGSVICRESTKPSPSRDGSIDICNDPRAYPGPDQCPEIPVSSDSIPRPLPKPVGRFRAMTLDLLPSIGLEERSASPSALDRTDSRSERSQ